MAGAVALPYFKPGVFLIAICYVVVFISDDVRRIEMNKAASYFDCRLLKGE